MPERPKRRKNNKNKRKNKNRPDTNKNSSDVNIVDFNISETHDKDTDDLSRNPEVSNVVLEDTKLIDDELPILSKDVQNSGTMQNNSYSLIGDMNNNSNQLNNDVLPDSAFQKAGKSNVVDSLAYIVESPDQLLSKSKTKLKSVKSKSLDNEDDTNIIEITDDTMLTDGETATALLNSQNILVAQADSDIEWEMTYDLINVSVPPTETTGTISVTKLPFTVAQCDQNKSLTPDEEKSLRSYLKTLNLVTQPENSNAIEIKTEIEQIINQEIKQRLRKKGLADDFCVHKIGPSRILDVIDEEGSGESSIASRRQSYLSDKKSDIEDLEDDVFEDNKNKFKRKSVPCGTSSHKTKIGQLVPQECVLVGAKIKEPEVTEARGEWTMKTVEKMTGAEVVYLTDTSSSSSSLHEIEDDDDGMDTDVSIRMMTPTIEITDTENFLKKTFVAQNAKENQSTENLKDIEYCSAGEEKNHILEINNVGQDEKENKPPENLQTVEKNQQLNERKVSNTLEIEHEIDPETSKLIETMVNTEFTNTKNNENPKNNTNDHNVDVTNIKIGMDRTEITNNIECNCVPNSNEIEVLSTENIKTNLYVKDIDEKTYTSQSPQEISIEREVLNQIKQNEYDLEAKVIKCEFNDAINNLIKEVTSDSEEVVESSKDIFTRQDSSSSVDSSQCTAKYYPSYESLNDVSSILHDEIGNKINSERISSTTSHVKEVCECITGSTVQNKDKFYAENIEQPLRLKDLCVSKIALLPYGAKILEELASVSKRLQNFTAEGSISQREFIDQDQVNGIPLYCLRNVSTKETMRMKDPIPPPIKPRHSSLKKSHNDEHWTGIQTKSEPVYVCLSPSQKMLMDKTNTVLTKESTSQLGDMHSKFINRRGYDEYYTSDKQKAENEFGCPPIVPFKSQTGSRLLALIRDPSLTRNINSLNDRLNLSLDELKIKPTNRMIRSQNNDDESNFVQNFSFKPIPPPRPKKYSSTFYESDESSDFTGNIMKSIKSEKKVFHYSTGNLSKEIEDDVSAIQKMHRNLIDRKNEIHNYNGPRRPSLPKDLCEQQMEYIRKKEKEVEAEIQRLEALKNTVSPVLRQPKVPLIDKKIDNKKIKNQNNYFNSHMKDVAMSSQRYDSNKNKMSSLFSSSQEELLREKMYSEYVTQMAEREERKQHKVIKITNCPSVVNSKISKSMSALNKIDSKVNNRIEKEFISKARERWDKLGIKDPETEDERENTKDVYKEPKVIEHKIKVIEGGKEKDVKKLPHHLQEFVRFTAKDKKQCDSSGESKAGPATPQLVIVCAVIIVVIAVGKYFLRLLRYNN